MRSYLYYSNIKASLNTGENLLLLALEKVVVIDETVSKWQGKTTIPQFYSYTFLFAIYFSNLGDSVFNMKK